jgi:hypothetical protein
MAFFLVISIYYRDNPQYLHCNNLFVTIATQAKPTAKKNALPP